MARLRNRILNAEFWADPELLRWPREKRWTYQGTWEMAEDSGCIEDDPFGWKLTLWPSPVDSDITVERLEAWRDELIDCHKLIPYEAEGKSYLFLRTFHEYEHPKNPQRPNLPLPAWVKWVADKDELKRSRGHYEVDWETLLSQYCDTTVSPVQSSPVQSSNPPTPLNSGDSTVPPESDPAIADLLAIAATVKSAKATWKPTSKDVEMFVSMRERFQAGQLRTELQKFKTYAIQRQYNKFGRAFTNWMGRVEPEKILGPAKTFVKPEREPEDVTPEEKAEAARICREARENLRRRAS